MAEIEFSLIAPYGDVLPLVSDMGTRDTYRLMRGVRGFGKTDVRATFAESAGEGSRHRRSIAAARSMTLPIETNGADRMPTGIALARLANALRSVEGMPNPRLVAAFDTGEVFELPIVYLSGAEDTYDESDRTVRQDIKVSAPKPYWVSREAVQIPVQQLSTSGPLLPNMAAMHLASSTAVGDITVQNVGDVATPIEVRITGPGGPTRFDIDGVGWVLNKVLGEGETRRIDSATKMVYRADGSKAYAELGPVPRFPHLPARRADVHIQMDGASAGRWESTGRPLHTNRVTTPALRDGSAGWSSWSNGKGTQSIATSGFDGSADGYLQIAWGASADPYAAVKYAFLATTDEVLSTSLEVISSRAQLAQAMVTYYNAADQVVMSVYGQAVEVPAQTVTRIGLAGSTVGPVPPGAVRGVMGVTIAANASSPWQSGDTLRASRADVTNTPEIEKHVDGRAMWCAWTGAVDASPSVRFVLERVGVSEVALYYKPRREVMH